MREWVGEIWIPHKASFLFREADPAREFGIAGVEPVEDASRRRVGRRAPNQQWTVGDDYFFFLEKRSQQTEIILGAALYSAEQLIP